MITNTPKGLFRMREDDKVQTEKEMQEKYVILRKGK